MKTPERNIPLNLKTDTLSQKKRIENINICVYQHNFNNI